MRALGISAALLLAGCATVPELPLQSVSAAWRPVDAQTGRIVDTVSLQQLARDIPDSGSVRRRLLNAQLTDGEFDGAIESLKWLHARGYVFSAGARARIEQMFGEARASEVRPLLPTQSERIANSTLHAIVPATAGLVESVLIDLQGGRMAVTSVSGRSAWATGSDGTLQAIAPENAGNLSGIVFDPARETIWAASGSIDGSKNARSAFSGLIEIVPGTTGGRRIAAPGDASLSDLHRAQDGTIYASDPLGGGIYRLPRNASAMETLVPAGTLRSPQGLVTSADGRKLYVSDYNYGIAVVDFATGQLSRLTTTLPIMLDGIDGLWRQGNELVAMQNGSSPMRIIALELSDDGLSVIGNRVLEQAHPEWSEPLSGYLGQGNLYYVANGQWDRWIDGKPVDGKPFTQTYIFKLPVAR